MRLLTLCQLNIPEFGLIFHKFNRPSDPYRIKLPGNELSVFLLLPARK
jgi:hypothetical protein